MNKVTNNGEGPLAFKDKDGLYHLLKKGETIECNVDRIGDPRLVIEKIGNDEKPKRKNKGSE